MIISRDRYLDDSRTSLISLALQTRTPEMHSLLSDAPDDVRERIGEALGRTLDQLEALLKPLVERPAAGRETSNFGCGT